MRGILTPLVAVLGALLFVPSSTPGRARAGTALRMDLDQVVAKSNLILEARVLSKSSDQSPGGAIHTDHQLLVRRTFKGEDLPTRTLRLPGGMLASGRGLMLPGLPELHVGEDVILCLSEATADGSRVPCGLAQGKYALLRDRRGARWAVRGGTTLTLIDVDERESRLGTEVVEYADLVARITRAASPGAVREEDR